MSRVVAIVLRFIGYDHHADASREQAILQLSNQADEALTETEKTITNARAGLSGQKAIAPITRLPVARRS